VGRLVPVHHDLVDLEDGGGAGNLVFGGMYVWMYVCLWDFGGEGRVDCYDQTGELLYEVPVPAGQTTSVAFCGADLSTLAITTARYQLSPGELELTPLAGDVFFCDAPVAGRPAFTHWL
jgi:sugar lactone lactonase YvrE